MRLALTALIFLGLIQSSPAEADNRQPTPSALYGFEGVSFSRLHGELADRAGGVIQLQIGLGYQPKNSDWAYELMGRGGATVNGETATMMGWGVRAKRLVPLSQHFSLYGRAGVTENFFGNSSGPDLAGFGIEYGAGAMASFRVPALGFLFFPAFFMGVGPKVNLSLWADLGGEVGNLHTGHGYRGQEESYDYRASSGSYGLNVGGNF